MEHKYINNLLAAVELIFCSLFDLLNLFFLFNLAPGLSLHVDRLQLV